MIKMAEHLRLLAESTEFLRIMRNGDENADDIAGRFTGRIPELMRILQVWDNL